jgi:hypothetical protein
VTGNTPNQWDINGQIKPIILDLNGSGIHLTSAQNSPVTIMDNSVQESLGWITSGEGVLMLNSNGNGTLTNINQISFASYVPGAQTDLQGLAAFDTNGDGKLDAGDALFNEFGVLLANGKFVSLEQLGITSINLTSNNQEQTLNGNTIYGITTYQTAKGQTLDAADTALATANIYTGPSSQFFNNSKSNGSILHFNDIFPETKNIDFSKLPENLANNVNSEQKHNPLGHESYGPSSVHAAIGEWSAGDIQHINDQLQHHHHETHH